MKHSVSLAITLLLGCATGAAVSQVAVPSASASAPAARWEYFCTDQLQKDGPDMDAGMNKLGREGWELATANHETGSKWTFCFKRGLP
jgi:hypothetical protein